MIYNIVNKRSDGQYITYIGALWQADIFLSTHPATIHILPKLTNQMPCYIVSRGADYKIISLIRPAAGRIA